MAGASDMTKARISPLYSSLQANKNECLLLCQTGLLGLQFHLVQKAMYPPGVSAIHRRSFTWKTISPIGAAAASGGEVK